MILAEEFEVTCKSILSSYSRLLILSRSVFSGCEMRDVSSSCSSCVGKVPSETVAMLCVGLKR